MNRREFNKVLGAVGVSLAAGARALASQGDAKKPDTKKAPDKAAEKAPKHICKAKNECKGQGGCKTGDGGCAGKNSCKAKGGCATNWT